jgi:hypothetical protein
VTGHEVDALLAECARRGLRLIPEADSPRVRVRGKLTPELRERLRADLAAVRAELVRLEVLKPVFETFPGARVVCVIRAGDEPQQ